MQNVKIAHISKGLTNFPQKQLLPQTDSFKQKAGISQKSWNLPKGGLKEPPGHIKNTGSFKIRDSSHKPPTGDHKLTLQEVISNPLGID